jgi:uncharacterized protein YoxC
MEHQAFNKTPWLVAVVVMAIAIIILFIMQVSTLKTQNTLNQIIEERTEALRVQINQVEHQVNVIQGEIINMQYENKLNKK